MSTIFYEDEALLFTRADGTKFEAKATYVENDGQRIFVITTDSENFGNLRDGAEKMATHLKDKYLIPTERLTYYERQPDGNIYRVDHSNMGAGPDRYGAPGPKEPRSRVSEPQVLRELDGARLPDVEQRFEQVFFGEENKKESETQRIGREVPWKVQNAEKDHEQES